MLSYKVAEHKTKLTLLDYKTQQDKQRKEHNGTAKDNTKSKTQLCVACGKNAKIIQKYNNTKLMLVGIKITTTLHKNATEHNTTKNTEIPKHNKTRLTVLVENSMRRVFSSLMSGQTRHRSPATLSHNDCHDNFH